MTTYYHNQTSPFLGKTSDRKKYHREWETKNREYVNRRARERRLENLQHRREIAKEWRVKNRGSIREYWENYRENNLLHMREQSKNSANRVKRLKYNAPNRPDVLNCEMCNKELHGRQIHLDHDHNTNKFRGWLCIKCNVALGYFENYAELAKSYLDKKNNSPNGVYT